MITVQEIKRSLESCLSAAGIEKAVLFGSFARGTQTRKSDIDLLIVKKTSKRFFDRYDDFKEVYRLLEDYDVEMFIYTPEEIERNENRSFIKRIFSEGILIYGN
jgi:predicted nucleotidyltransferase